MGQKGQTFLIAMMLMLIALFVGITSSTRFLKTLRTITQTDNSSKAQAVAEAAVERMLVLPSDTLTDYINNNNCGSDCYYEITDATGQSLTANVNLSFIGNSTDSYELKLHTDEVNQIALGGYQSGRTLDICWNGNDASIIGHYVYSDDGKIKVVPVAYNPVVSINGGNNFSSGTALYGYSNCFTVTATKTPLALRLRSVYADAVVNALPQAGYSIPIQGIQIDSTGKAGDATKKVTVIKSSSFVPAYFDYVLYQKSPTEALSN